MADPFGRTGTGEKDESSSASSGGGGGRRGNVHVKGVLGTKTYKPDTQCNRCTRRAVGVWIKGDTDKITAEQASEPLCGKHRDMIKKDTPSLWENTEFRRFVD